MTTLSKGALVLTLWAVAATAQAQDIPKIQPAGFGEPSQIRSNTGEITLDRPMAGSGLELTAGQEDSSMVLKANWRVPGFTSYQAVSLTISTPLKDDVDLTKVATLDGLAGAATAKVGWEGGWVTGVTDPSRLSLDSQGAWSAKFADLCARVDKAVPGTPCDSESARKAGLGDLAEQLDDMFYAPNAKVILWDVGGKVGRQDYTYYDGATLAKHEESQTPWSLSAGVTLYPRKANYLFTLGYERQRAFEEAASAKLCGPPGGGGVVTCIEGPIGAPTRKDKDLWSVGYRAKTRLFAFSLTGTYDSKAEVFGIDAPIYVLRNAEGEWSGGLRLGWRDDTGAVTTAIFVSKPFAVFGSDE